MLTNLSPPLIEPVSLEDTKRFLRVDHDDENDLILALIASARERLESYLNICLISRPLRSVQPAKHAVTLPRWPVQSVDAVRLDDIVTTDFDTDLRSRPGRVFLRIDPGPDATLTIDFTAGFGTARDDLPTPLQQAIWLLVSQGYEHRDSPDMGLPLMVDALTQPYRMVSL